MTREEMIAELRAKSQAPTPTREEMLSHLRQPQTELQKLQFQDPRAQEQGLETPMLDPLDALPMVTGAPAALAAAREAPAMVASGAKALVRGGGHVLETAMHPRNAIDKLATFFKGVGKAAPEMSGARNVVTKGIDDAVELGAHNAPMARPVNPELTERLAMETRPTPALEAPSPSISRPVNNELAEALKPAPKVELEAMRPSTPTTPNPELTEALRPAPSIELGPTPPTAPRSGSNGPSLQDILRYAEQQGTPATGQPAALESTLANAIKPKWNGPKIQRRGVE